MAQLLRSEMVCPGCGRLLDQVGTRFGAGPAGAGEEAWRAVVEAEVISCSAGHAFEAVYEQRERWLRVLIDVGAPIELE